MANFDFEALKRKANEVADKGMNFAMKAADVARTKAKIAKLKTEIIGEKEKARKAYQEIGKIYYHLHKDDPEADFSSAIADLEVIIDSLKDKYAAIQQLRSDDVAEPAEDAAVVVESVIPQTDEEIEEAIFTDVEKAAEEPAEEEPEAEAEAEEEEKPEE